MNTALPRTLGKFFDTSGMTWRVLDMGRRVVQIPALDFARFEATERPYPFPFRRHAWCGLVFRPRRMQHDPLLWFLKFPLDEQGFLVQASRDYVLRRIFEAFGARLAQGPQGVGEDARGDGMNVMKDNPFAFQPDETRLAVFHAKASRLLGLATSAHHAPAARYFNAEAPINDWEGLGLQGIADFAIRVATATDRAAMVSRLRSLPGQPFVALCTCLENVSPPGDVVRAIVSRAQSAIATGEPASVVAAGIRGISAARSVATARRFVHEVLVSPYGADIEVQAAVAGRAWELLEDDSLQARYLERLAEVSQPAFEAIITDLLFMPGLRETLLRALRDPHRSSTLRARFEALAESRQPAEQ